PRAPSPSGAAPAMCRSQERPASEPAERQVLAAGGHLESYWATQRAGDATLVLAAVDNDGMWRPVGFSGFGFVGEGVAATRAPSPMASRSDGALTGAPALTAGGTGLTATFQRYAAPTRPAAPPARTRG